MPLEIAYRPVALSPAALPPAAVMPRAGDGHAPGVGQACPAPNPVPPHRPEPRPRDFVARIRRRDMVSLRRALHRPARLRQRIAGVALVGLLPALLTVLGWGDPRGISGAVAQDRLPAWHDKGAAGSGMAGSPASAGTAGLLTPAVASAAWDRTVAGAHSDADSTMPSTYGPTARPMPLVGTGLDRWRALQCLTAAIYYEAAREPDAGQRAVAQVVLNRVAHPAFPKTVCGVVYQGSERPGCQFSFACDGSLARRPMAAWWDRARRVAEVALAGNVFAPIGLATHYHTSAVHPGWADSMSFLGTIGAHRFYRWSGSAGQPRAFNAVYAGGEPLAAPHPHGWASTGADLADPLVLEKAFEAGRLAALRSAFVANPTTETTMARSPVAFGQQPPARAAIDQPALANDPASDARARILPGSGAVRPEAEPQYDGAAHWIHQPGT